MSKIVIAARVAAELRKLPDVEVTIVPGGLGELRIDIGGQDVYESNRFLYPSPRKIVSIVRDHLTAK